MPHLIVNYGKSVLPQQSVTPLLEELCQSLSKVETFKLSDIKARAIENGATVCGSSDGADRHIHLTLHVMPGRSSDVLNKALDEVMELVAATVPTSVEITAEITLIDKELYRKRLPQVMP
jgi:5-carboxymethyl-2-hydroxymuconate isomerase